MELQSRCPHGPPRRQALRRLVTHTAAVEAEPAAEVAPALRRLERGDCTEGKRLRLRGTDSRSANCSALISGTDVQRMPNHSRTRAKAPIRCSENEISLSPLCITKVSAFCGFLLPRPFPVR